MEQFGIEIAKAATSLVGAVVIAFLTVFLAIRRYYAEKWSKRKWEAYNGLFDALHNVRNYYDQQWEYTVRRQSDLLPDEEKRLDNMRSSGMAEIRRRIDVGTLVFSDEAMSVLKKFLADLDKDRHSRDWTVHLDNQLSATGKCLEGLRPIARKELAHR